MQFWSKPRLAAGQVFPGTVRCHKQKLRSPQMFRKVDETCTGLAAPLLAGSLAHGRLQETSGDSAAAAAPFVGDKRREMIDLGSHRYRGLLLPLARCYASAAGRFDMPADSDTRQLAGRTLMGAFESFGRHFDLGSYS